MKHRKKLRQRRLLDLSPSESQPSGKESKRRKLLLWLMLENMRFWWLNIRLVSISRESKLRSWLREKKMP